MEFIMHTLHFIFKELTAGVIVLYCVLAGHRLSMVVNATNDKRVYAKYIIEIIVVSIILFGLYDWLSTTIKYTLIIE